ncbi:TraB/GumN family protein [Desulfovibrio sp. OttesenSCG-928-G15]|nr:TraB/GumN family protein [Desulfovibrio sp. OttesenSCG-928-G15]
METKALNESEPAVLPVQAADAETLAKLMAGALVPEHSIPFMRSMSGGRPLVCGNYLFFASDDWLMAIGYKLDSVAAHRLYADATSDRTLVDAVYDHASFQSALHAVLEQTGAERCFAVAPDFPERIAPYIENSDSFYILPTDGQPPQALRGPLARAAKKLTIREGRVFTPEHRRLWAEFLGRVTMRPTARALYAKTEETLALVREGKSGADLLLLDALDESGTIAASLLLDFSPDLFCAYIIGAHSRQTYSAHATDLLFAHMLELARQRGKKYIHLGLGVNEGITRFKRKWGGRLVLPFRMASWIEAPRKSAAHARAGGGADTRTEIGRAMQALLSAPAGLSKQQIFDTFPRQRTFAMIREVRKGNAVSYLCGTAHFFCFSFELSFRQIFEPLDTVIFEGPLDEDFLAAVEKHGRNPDKDAPALLDMLTKDELAELERVVYGPEGFWASLRGVQKQRRVDVRELLGKTRHWFAFFSLWVAFLERQGWSQSVDLEAWHTAKDMGKQIVGMENLEEQIDSLEVIPVQRVIDFIRRARYWPEYMKRNIASYLRGDLAHMLGTSIEFPSRTEQVIDRRDERFRQRMRPFLEAGNCAVFVGSAHLLGLTPMLEADGFTVRPYYPSRMLQIKAHLRELAGRG